MTSKLAPVKILPLGDSHTYGMVSSMADREAGGYRLYLDKKLKEAGLSFDMVGRLRNGPTSFDRDHEGYSGHHAVPPTYRQLAYNSDRVTVSARKYMKLLKDYPTTNC